MPEIDRIGQIVPTIHLTVLTGHARRQPSEVS